MPRLKIAMPTTLGHAVRSTHAPTAPAIAHPKRIRGRRRPLFELALAGAIACFASACGKDDTADSQPVPSLPEKAQRAAAVVGATFVGSKTCTECHGEEVAEWHGSDHQLAMQVADEKTVLGDFDNTRFEHFGIETTFRREGEQFLVTTPNSEGVPTEYKIDYTFGHDPLQQYLIAFPGGRYQALRSAGTRGRKRKAASAGFTSTQTRRCRTTTCSTGPGSISTGTTCAPTATRPT